MVAGSWGGARVSGAGGEGLGDAAPEAGGGTELGDAAGETHGLRLRRPNGLGSGGTVWEIVTEETKGDYWFFKVLAEMP